MKTETILRALLLTTVILTGIIAGSAIVANASTSTFRVVQTPVYHLYTGESGSATTMRITPYPTDLDGTKLTIADFGSLPVITVDPGLKSIEEIEQFTGIVDNGDGTATLSGLTRDLLSKYPYTTAGTGRTHGSGATVVFGNSPQIYGRLAAPENTNTWTSDQTYSSTTHPGFDIDPGASYFTTGPGTTFVDYSQLSRTALAGTVNGGYTVQGVFQAARPIDAASTTSLGSTGAFLALTTAISTSTCQVATSSAIISQTNGKINGGCFDNSFSYNYTGNNTYNGTTTFAKTMISGVNSLTDNGTTTLDWSLGNTAVWVLTGNHAVVFLNVQAGESLKVLACQDGTGSRTVPNWGNTSTTSMRWATGFAPTLTTTGGKCDVVSLFTGTSTAQVFGAVTTNF